MIDQSWTSDKPSHPMPQFDENKALRHILKGTASETGAGFFVALVNSLSSAFNTDFAWITEYLPESESLRALAFLQDDNLVNDFEYAISGTPCEPVIKYARMIHHPEDVQSCYPQDDDLKKLGMVSYMGVPLIDSDGSILGHMAVMDRKTMPEQPQGLTIFRIFAARATAELQRLRAEKTIRGQEQEQLRLRDQLQEANVALNKSEQRFRDLFDEAPIAYVHEDMDSRFIQANHAALRILGIKPEEAVGTIGKSLVADTPDNQLRLEEAFQSIGSGTNTAGVVLELRRKDNGKPVWIQWWSKPAPDGSYTRTMFIDITERVQIEQEKARLEAHNTYLEEEIRSSSFNEIIGSSQAMQQVFTDLEQVAATKANVLIQGETGTGKELIARAIHEASDRAKQPLIKVNCGALPESLIESELFGHEQGAFTGATKKRDGRFKLADGGTLFLDEVGELPLSAQVKLLRVLQEGEFEAVGSSRTVKIDVRVIAATNRDLFEETEKGTFREDLYYRLAVFPITVPPLRDRHDDIQLLAQQFLNQYTLRAGQNCPGLTENQLTQLAQYHWPGNVRELQNVMERVVITSRDGALNLHRALPEAARSPTNEEHPTINQSAGDSIYTVEELHQLERDNIIRALKTTDWQVSGKDGAAQLLGINASTLNSRLKTLGIKRKD